MADGDLSAALTGPLISTTNLDKGGMGWSGVAWSEPDGCRAEGESDKLGSIGELYVS